MNTRKRRILIVDDEESIRRSLHAYFEDEGFEVAAIDSAEAGLEEMSRTPADAVIVDMRLPGMDGNAFIERVGAFHPNAKVFIFTGSVGYQPPLSLQRMGIGPERVFLKPLQDMSVLVEAIRNLVEARSEP